MNKLRSNKLFALFAAISSVIIVAGIILYALLGFNTAKDRPAAKFIDVSYGTTVVNGTVGTGEAEKDASVYLEENVEKILKDNGLTYAEKTTFENGALTSNDLNASGQSKTVRYTFPSKTADDKLEAAVTGIEGFVKAQAGSPISEGVEYVTWHASENLALKKAAWRGAIGIAVGAIVALIYLTIRFGVSCGVAGLAVAAHDALFTAAFFALTRIPVYGFAPLLYAAIAAFASVAVWTVLSIHIRKNTKDPENAGLAADALADKSVDGAWKYVVLIAAALAVIVVVFGLIAAAGTRALVLPAIVGCLLPVYSTLLIGPKIFVPIRKAFDKKRASKKGGYVRKKKKAELEAEE